MSMSGHELGASVRSGAASPPRFLFGVFWAYACSRPGISAEARAVVLVGFMGAFTTFSSVAFDTQALTEGSQWAWAAGNVVLQNVVGIAFVMLGIATCRAT